MRRSRFPLFGTIVAFVLIMMLCGGRAVAQSESTFYVFCSAGGEDCTDGEEPTYGAQLIQAADGNLWGVTEAAGTAGELEGWGTLYKISLAGKYTVVHSFCSEGSGACTDGGIPKGGLVQGPDGNIYGTTSFTGAAGGTVFKVTPGGTFSTLYTFCTGGGSCTDGSLPEGGLVIGTDGNIYGTTYYGGSGGGGTAYKMTLSGTLTTLHNFGSENDQSNPTGLVQATDGNFYGTTTSGGTNPTGTGQGTVFKMTPSGGYTTIYSFCQIYQNGICQDGRGPAAVALVETSSGVLEGTTEDGGMGTMGTTDAGTIFTVTLGGSESVVYNYCSTRNTNYGCTDGFHPYSGGFIAGDGNFYTTTANGGLNGEGTVSNSGSAIYNFCAAGMPCTDGYLPYSPPIQDSEGNLYGTTDFGGTMSNCYCGVIWKISGSAATAPVQVTLNPTSVAPNSATTLSWKVLNAFSDTMQQCYAFEQGSATGAGTWTGKQTGSYSSSTKLYTGSATITPTADGTYTYALTCGGQESGFATLTVSGTQKSSSTTTVTATPSSPTVGQSVALKATVSGSSGTPTGSVSFAVDGFELGSANLSGGAGTFSASTNGQAPGKYPVIATYGGSSTYDGSASSPLSVTLGQAPTSTGLTVSPTTVTPPGTAMLTATVTRSASGATGTPTGSVTFYADGSFALATVALKNGVATLTASSKGIAAGKYTITAKYLGDSSDVTSTSAGVAVTVE
jgi:uncharacterized repeat protein (TIGR03803 family)